MREFTRNQKMPNLIGYLSREQHSGVGDLQRKVLADGGKGAFLHRQQAIVRFRQVTIQQPGHAEGSGAADRADFTRRRRPALRRAGQQ